MCPAAAADRRRHRGDPVGPDRPACGGRCARRPAPSAAQVPDRRRWPRPRAGQHHLLGVDGPGQRHHAPGDTDEPFNASQNKVHVTLVDQASYTTTWRQVRGRADQRPAADGRPARGHRTCRGRSTPSRSCPRSPASTPPTTRRRTSSPGPSPTGRSTASKRRCPSPSRTRSSTTTSRPSPTAGLNPTTPPATLAQYLADAKALKAHGSGTGLVLDPWHLETWLATANTLFVNNEQRPGHAGDQGGRSTGRRARLIFTDLDQLVTSGDAVTNPATGPDDLDNLLGIGAGKYGMTIDTSADLGTITQACWPAAATRTCTLGVGPFPVLSSKVQRRHRARRLGPVHLEQGARRRSGGGLGVRHLPRQPAEPGHLGRGHRATSPIRKSSATTADHPAAVGVQPRLQGGLRPAGQRGQQRRHGRAR